MPLSTPPSVQRKGSEMENAKTENRAASVLIQMAVPHPYYCSESNYYSNHAACAWETMTAFLAVFDNFDIDMNFVFRWDIRQYDADNSRKYYAEVFMVHQRKGIFSPHFIKYVNEDEATRFRAYLEKHWERMQELWAPLSANLNQTPPKAE